MNDYRDLRFSVPGWWFAIVMCSIIGLSGYTPQSKENWDKALAVVVLIVSGPSVSYIISVFSYVFTFRKCQDKIATKILGKRAGTMPIIELQVIKNMPPPIGYTESFHNTIARSWSYSTADCHTTIAIVIGSIFGTLATWLLDYTINCRMIWAYGVCALFVVVLQIHRHKVRTEIILMQKVYFDKTHDDKIQ